MSSFHLHQVSDSTGETVGSIARASLVQFEDVDVIEHFWPLVRTSTGVEKALDGIAKNPGMVFYTISDDELEKQLREGCKKLDVPVVPVLNRAVQALSKYFDQEATNQTGLQYELTEEYFERIEAINFALAHDDGKSAWELNEADVVVVGVSRTSKSPTCMYLAYRGLRTGNVVYIPGCDLPCDFSKFTNPLIVGLTISPERLVQIRQSRMDGMDGNKTEGYTDIDKVTEELKQARRFFNQQGWKVIDVTRRSVEETAALIIKHYEMHKIKK